MSGYARVRFMDRDGVRSFDGNWQVRADGAIVGQRKTGPLEATTLHLAILRPEDVLGVWFEDPKYGGWTRATVEQLVEVGS